MESVLGSTGKIMDMFVWVKKQKERGNQQKMDRRKTHLFQKKKKGVFSHQKKQILFLGNYKSKYI